ncbi:hypothetical protein Cni_G00061 [Canna indica]|uniref:Uncharacterized protein n=1 Tax=Canna indica TaxID=4628 RepID=A0AAQ3JLT2_9LILI|nr:hypothetical protein Cni_G00061 [Canna indica]
MVKGTGAVTVASTVITAAASYTTALSGSLSDPKLQALIPIQDRVSPQGHRPNQERFSPRFDGLRFVETLITAHR